MTTTTVPPQLAHRAVTLTDGATVATDASLGGFFILSLTGSHTLGAPTNLTVGVPYVWRIDNTGAFTLAYNAIFDWGDKGAPTITSGAGKRSYLGGFYNGTTLDMVAYDLGHG